PDNSSSKMTFDPTVTLRTWILLPLLIVLSLVSGCQALGEYEAAEYERTYYVICRIFPFDPYCYNRGLE
ncbi:hypothetical protein Bpfe_002538, partial [Biomphalaria pfeifferi]